MAKQDIGIRTGYAVLSEPTQLSVAINLLNQTANYIKAMIGTYSDEIASIQNKMKANGDNPHNHFAYRMVDAGEEKQLNEIINGTFSGKPSASTRTEYGLIDILRYIDMVGCTITYDITGADGVAPERVKKVWGGSFSLAPKTGITPKKGQVISGWYVDHYNPSKPKESGYEEVYKFGDTFHVPYVDNITLHLKIGVETCNVTFNLNGGNGTTPGSLILRYGDTFTVPIPQATYVGRAFSGWSDTSAGDVIYRGGDSAVFQGGGDDQGRLTLFAVWTLVQA